MPSEGPPPHPSGLKCVAIWIDAGGPLVWPPPRRGGQIGLRDSGIEGAQAAHGNCFAAALDGTAAVTLPVRNAYKYRPVHNAHALGWHEVATDPVSFLSLEVVPASWLDAVRPILAKAEAGDTGPWFGIAGMIGGR